MWWVLVVILVSIFTPCSPSCIYIENTLLEWNNISSTTNNITFTLKIPFGMKWIAIGFNNNTHTMPGASIYMYYDKQLNQYNGIGFSIPQFVNPIEFENLQRDQLEEEDEFWEHHIRFTIFDNESRILQNQERILLAYNTNTKPVSPTQFEKHTNTFVRDRNLFTTGDECMLASARLYGTGKIGFIVAWYIILTIDLVLCILFRNKQPLKSRGYVPISTVVLTLQYCCRLVVETVTSREWQVQYLCYFPYLISFPSEMAVWVGVVLQCIRYLLVINLNNLKRTFCLNREAGINERKVRVLKILTAPWTSFAVLAVLWIVTIVEGLVFISIHQFNCLTITPSPIPYTWAMIYGGLLSIIALIVVGIDFFTHMIKHKCNLISYYFVRDPYMYRVEILLYFITIGFYGSGNIARLFYNNPNIDRIIYTIAVSGITLVISLFPLSVSIVNELKRRLIKQRQNGDQKIEDILDDEVPRELFIEHAKHEWSVENIMLWDDIQNFKKQFGKRKSMFVNRNQHLKDMVQDIYNKYLKGNDALFEVNIDRSTCQTVLDAIIKDTIDEKTLDAVERATRQNLMDTFQRFRVSKPYKQYLKGLKQAEELAKNSGLV